MGAVIPFEPGAPLARIEATPNGYAIDCRSPSTARRYEFAQPGETAEFATALRDAGGWRLRYRPGTDEVRSIVAELDEMDGEGGA